MLIERQSSQLLIIDMQERLVPAVHEGARVVQKCATLLSAADLLGVPALISEQYPQGLGPTVTQVAERAGTAQIVEKIHFSCSDDETLRAGLTISRDDGRATVVIAGVEAHVCVAQTAMKLVHEDFRVIVVADAISSRRVESKGYAMERMGQAGIEFVDTEMVVFEWLNKAGTPEFKSLLAMIK